MTYITETHELGKKERERDGGGDMSSQTISKTVKTMYESGGWRVHYGTIPCNLIIYIPLLNHKC